MILEGGRHLLFYHEVFSTNISRKERALGQAIVLRSGASGKSEWVS